MNGPSQGHLLPHVAQNGLGDGFAWCFRHLTFAPEKLSTYIMHFLLFQPFPMHSHALSCYRLLSLSVSWFFVFWFLSVSLEPSWFTLFALLFSICGLTVTLVWSHISGVAFITVFIWSFWCKSEMVLTSSLYSILLESWDKVRVWLLFTWFDNAIPSLLCKNAISSLNNCLLKLVALLKISLLL